MSVLPYHWHAIHPSAAVHYVRDVLVADTLVDDLSGPVGFDLEWKPTFTKGSPENPVALVQLANEHIILAIQVSEMKQFPMKLKNFLENPDIVKAGVGIQNDAKKLYKDWQVSTRNCVDLSLLARCVDNTQWKGKYNTPLGLARLVEAYESRVLPKGKISRSNWEGRLTSSQVDYAANDAHAGFVLYQRLSAMANAMSKVPKPVYYSFNIVRGFLCEPSGMHWNCDNPDYDPGPPPPKPSTQPNAQRVQIVRPRAAVQIRDTAGATLASDSVLPESSQRSTSPSPTSSRSAQIVRPRAAVQIRDTASATLASVSVLPESSQSSTSPSPTSSRSARIAFLRRSIRRRNDLLPDSKSEEQGSSVIPPTSPRSSQVDFLLRSTQRRADSLSRLNSGKTTPSSPASPSLSQFQTPQSSSEDLT